MDLSSPIAVVTPTLDAGVLHVLAATTSKCTAAEIHRRVGHGSDEGVRKVLRRLVRQGIVTVETPSRHALYHLNRQHLAAASIETLTRLRAELFDRICSEVETWEWQPTHSSLFGSFARGTADADSDIDVLIVRPSALTQQNEGSWLKQLDQLGQRIEAWTGNDAQIVEVTTETLGSMARDADPLIDSWRADAIHVSGERLLDLLRRSR